MSIRVDDIEIEVKANGQNASMGLRQFANALSKVQGPTQKATSGMKRVSNALNSIKSVASKVAGSFANLTKHTNHSTGALGKMLGALKRIAVYRLLRTIIKEITESFREGIQNIARYSAALNGMDTSNANGSMSQLASNALYLKNSLGALAAPILNLVLPAINKLVDAVAKAIQYISAFFSFLGGKKTFTVAKKQAVDYAGSLDKASSSAKKLKDNLLGIDELNIISPDDENSGGGGGASTPDYGSMFEENPIPNDWMDIFDWLKSMWDKADFFELGKMLGDKLAEMLANIPWDKIKYNCYKIGKSIATFINGFMRGEFEGQELSYLLGKTIAEFINSAFTIAYGFVTNFDWSYFGHFIANTFNGFFENIDWNLIYATCIIGFEGLAKSINTFITDTKWDVIGQSLAKGINTIIDSGLRFLKTLDITEMGNAFFTFLNNAIGGINWYHLGKFLGEIVLKGIELVTSVLKNAPETIMKLADGMQEMFRGMVEQLNFDGVAHDIWMKFFEAFNGWITGGAFGVENFATSSKHFTSQMFDGMVDADIGQKKTAAKLFDAIAGGTKEVDTKTPTAELVTRMSNDFDNEITSKSSQFYNSWGKSVDPAIASAIQSTEIKTVSLVKNYGQNVGSTMDGVTTGVLTKSGYDSGSKLVESVNTAITENEGTSATTLDEWLTSVGDVVANYDKWYEMLQNIQLAFTDVWTEISELFLENTTIWWEESVMPLFEYEKWYELLMPIQDAFSDTWDEVNTLWNTNLENWYENDVKPKFLKDLWIKTIEPMKEAFKEQFDEIKEIIFEAIDEAKDHVLEACHEMEEAVNSVLSAIQGLGSASVSGSITITSAAPKQFASGGFPTQGQMFIARESGAEMVGAWGNQSAVANNEQIVAGIRQGVADAVSGIVAPYLAQITSNTNDIASKDNSIYIGDDEIKRSYDRATQRSGFSFI